MQKNTAVRTSLIIFFLLFLVFVYSKFLKKESPILLKINETEEKSYNSNIMIDVNYVSRDKKGNEYIIDATEGEIDLAKKDIIFLTDVRSLIKLNNSNNVKITSNFGKYNIINYDTIFSKNVIVTYLDNRITGEYLDFSTARNSMIISRNVVYNNNENILKADVVEIDITTKDTKIFMYEDSKKINIKSKD